MNCTRFRFLIQQRFDREISPQDDRALLIHLETCESCQKFHHQVQQVILAAEELPIQEDLLPIKLESLARKIFEQLPEPKTSLLDTLVKFFQNLTLKGGGEGVQTDQQMYQSQSQFPHVRRAKSPAEQKAESSDRKLANVSWDGSEDHSENVVAPAHENKEMQSSSRSLSEKFGLQSNSGALNVDQPLTLAESIRRKISESQRQTAGQTPLSEDALKQQELSWEKLNSFAPQPPDTPIGTQASGQTPIEWVKPATSGASNNQAESGPSILGAWGKPSPIDSSQWNMAGTEAQKQTNAANADNAKQGNAAWGQADEANQPAPFWPLSPQNSNWQHPSALPTSPAVPSSFAWEESVSSGDRQENSLSPPAAHGASTNSVPNDDMQNQSPIIPWLDPTNFSKKLSGEVAKPEPASASGKVSADQMPAAQVPTQLEGPEVKLAGSEIQSLPASPSEPAKKTSWSVEAEQIETGTWQIFSPIDALNASSAPSWTKDAASNPSAGSAALPLGTPLSPDNPDKNWDVSVQEKLAQQRLSSEANFDATQSITGLANSVMDKLGDMLDNLDKKEAATAGPGLIAKAGEILPKPALPAPGIPKPKISPVFSKNAPATDVAMPATPSDVVFTARPQEQMTQAPPTVPIQSTAPTQPVSPQTIPAGQWGEAPVAMTPDSNNLSPTSLPPKEIPVGESLVSNKGRSKKSGLFNLNDNDIDQLFSEHLGVSELSTQVSGNVAGAPLKIEETPVLPQHLSLTPQLRMPDVDPWQKPKAANLSEPENSSVQTSPQPSKQAPLGQAPAQETFGQEAAFKSPQHIVNQPVEPERLFSLDSTLIDRMFGEQPKVSKPDELKANKDPEPMADKAGSNIANNIESLPVPKIEGLGRLDSRSDISEEIGSGRISSIGNFLLDGKDLEKIGNITTSGPVDSKTRVLTMEAATELITLLQIVGAQKGVVGSIIIGHDGLIIASTMPPDLDTESFKARAMALYMGTQQATKKMGSEQVHQLVMKTPLGYLVIADFGGGLLVTTSDAKETSELIPLMRSITQLVTN